jgi:hypothetical protein
MKLAKLIALCIEKGLTVQIRGDQKGGCAVLSVSGYSSSGGVVNVGHRFTKEFCLHTDETVQTMFLEDAIDNIIEEIEDNGQDEPYVLQILHASDQAREMNNSLQENLDALAMSHSVSPTPAKKDLKLLLQLTEETTETEEKLHRARGTEKLLNVAVSIAFLLLILYGIWATVKAEKLAIENSKLKRELQNSETILKIRGQN